MWWGCAPWNRGKFMSGSKSSNLFLAVCSTIELVVQPRPSGNLNGLRKTKLTVFLGISHDQVFLIKSSWNLDRVKRLLVHSKEDSKHQITSPTSVNPFASTLELFLVSLVVFFLPAVRYLSSFSAFASASKINNVWWGWSTAVRSISYNTISTQYTYTRWHVTSC